MKLTSYTLAIIVWLATLVSSPIFAQDEGDEGGNIMLPNTSSKIVGGVKSTEQYSWMVSIQTRSNGSHFCGGTLISPNWVVTASHCVSDLTAEDLALVIGTLDRVNDSDDGEVRYVDQIITHPSYFTSSNGIENNDIALLTLSMSSQKAPLSLASSSVSSELELGTNVKTLGWGLTSENGSFTERYLREVAVSFQSDARCQEIYDQSNVYWDANICAGETDGGYDSCQGDSGGPLLAQVDNTDTLVGIVSYGAGCAQPNAYGVYTDVTYFINWITQTINAWSIENENTLIVSGPENMGVIGFDGSQQVRQEYDTFYVKNIGASDKTISSVGISNSSVDFEVVSENELTGRTIAAESYCEFGVAANAESIGQKQASIQLIHSEGTSEKALTSFVVSPDANIRNALDAEWNWFTYGALSINRTWTAESGGFDGSFAQSGPVLNNDVTLLHTYVNGPGYVVFEANVSSEELFDGLLVYKDGGDEYTFLSGEISDTYSSPYIESGNHKLVFAYYKDSSITEGEDRAQINDVKLCTDLNDLSSCDQTSVSYYDTEGYTAPVNCGSLNLADVSVIDGTISSYVAIRSSSSNEDKGFLGLGSIIWLWLILPVLFRRASYKETH